MSDSCANPLLLEWIKEWLDQARERNSKGAIVYKKAYESMKACPLVFQHPSEAQQLNGLGPKLCDRLTEKLQAYCEENQLPMPEDPKKKTAAGGTAGRNKRTSDEGVADDNPQPAKKARKPRPYVPTMRSGPYALLLGLATVGESSTQGLTKAQLVEKAQPFCDSSFTIADDPKKYFTAWNSMKTLLQKDLVCDHGHPLKKYALTEDGWEVAKRLIKTLSDTEQSVFSAADALAQQTSAIPGTTTPTETDPFHQHPPTDPKDITPIPLPPTSFTIQLILDTREVRASKDRDYISNELHRKGVPHEVRALELGDVMWVAKFHDPATLTQHGEEDQGVGSNEVTLDYIVERKRLDDLLGSIKDGRFHEQKFRLNRSGMTNVVYLIEESAMPHGGAPGDAQSSRYQEMVVSAMASTQVVNGYFVKKTKNLDDTIRYLARMTFLLNRMYTSASASGPPPSRTLNLIPSRQLSSAQSYLDALDRLRAENPSATFGVTFPTFAALSSKSDVLALRDVFLKMLMCTKGVTGEKALEIQRRWQTPQAFVRAFEALRDPKEKEAMVAEQVKSVVGRKSVGKALSKKIAEVWAEEG